MPPLYARPRHAAPRDTNKLRAALVPAVLVASTGSALGGLAAGASADGGVVRAAAASTALSTSVDVEALRTERLLAVEQSEARASRDRALADQKAAEAAAAAETARLAAEAEAARVVAEQAAQAEAARKAAEAAAPKVARPGTGRISSTYGPRWGRMHNGIDIAAGMGKPIMAAMAGTVVSARNEGGYGNTVRIEHGDGTITVYAHNASLLVRAGQKVTAGQQIAKEGSSGNSTGPHVHFEVRIGGSTVNPITWLRARGLTSI